MVANESNSDAEQETKPDLLHDMGIKRRDITNV